jgi:hypothetical protein
MLVYLRLIDYDRIRIHHHDLQIIWMTYDA